MRKLLTILISFSVLCSSTLAQQCENGFYNFKEGATWELSNFDTKGKSIGYTTFILSGVTATDGAIKGKLHYTIYDEKKKQVVASDFSVECINGDIKMDTKSIISEKQLKSYKKDEIKIVKDDALVFPQVMQIGATLPNGSLNGILESNGAKVAKISYETTERVVLAKESITVPAGTFECYKISTKVHSVTSIGVSVSYDYELIEWYAIGIGVVRSETYKKANLESYSVLTNLSK